MGNIKDPIDFLIEAEEEKLRKKIEWPEDQLDYSDSVTIKITKVKFDDKFTHWEADLSFAEDGFYCSCTAPTMAGAVDEVMNYLYDSVYEWTKDDANEQKKIERPKYIVKVTRDWRYGKRARFWEIQKWYQMGTKPDEGYWGGACKGGIAYSDWGMWRAINKKLKKMDFGYYENYFSLDRQEIKNPK